MQKLLLAAVFMASMQFAAAERAPIAIPKKVQEAINEDKQTCREMGGKFSVGQALDIIDLNNDGYHDFVYDMSKVCSCFFQNVAGIGNGLFGLLLNPTFHEIPSRWIDWNLSGCEYKTVDFDGLAIWPYSGRSVVCVNSFHINYFLCTNTQK